MFNRFAARFKTRGWIMERVMCAGLLVLGVTGCQNEIYDNPIPDCSVSLSLDLLGQYPTFRNSYNQYLMFTEPRYITDRIGYGGILVYTTLEGQYTAYDLACPVEVKKAVRVQPVEDEGIGHFKCAGCGEVYDLSYGFGVPTKGISKYPMKQYKTMIVGNNLKVYLK